VEIDDRRSFVLEAPVAYWTWSGPHFFYHSVPPEPWEHYFVSFYGDRTRQWDRRGLLPTGTRRPFADITNPEAFRAGFDTLLETLSRSPVQNPEAVHLLEGLLLQVHTQPERQIVHHPRRRQIQALMDRIDEHPERSVDFAGQASGMGMTLTHLRRLFGLFAGCSPIAYVNGARMRRAALLLRTTDAPIKEIASETGFSDVYYFTKLFSKHHDLPPGRYRRAFQQAE
jgi:AraC-like DNA-binding protein